MLNRHERISDHSIDNFNSTSLLMGLTISLSRHFRAASPDLV